MYKRNLVTLNENDNKNKSCVREKSCMYSKKENFVPSFN